MTISARITDLFSIELPIIQSPLLSLGTPELIAGVSESGGLGVLDAAFLNQDELYNQMSAIEMQTDKPYGVHLMLSKRTLSEEDLVAEKMADLRSLYQLPTLNTATKQHRTYHELESLVDLIIDQAVPVVIISMGIPHPDLLKRLKSAGIVVVGHVSHMIEALQWQEMGADALLLQGWEAGGLRTTFIGDGREMAIPATTLLEQARQLLRIPSIISGGIYRYEQVAGMMIQGADGVAVGTAFALTEESALPAVLIHQLMASNEYDSRINDHWLGIPARTWMNEGVSTIILAELESLTLTSRYDLLHRAMDQYVATLEESSAERRADDSSYAMLFPGINAQFCRLQSVYELMASLTIKLDEEEESEDLKDELEPK